MPNSSPTIADMTRKLRSNFEAGTSFWAVRRAQWRALGLTDADMEKPVDLFGTKTTARGAYMLLLSHAHEHLGQAIAYARSNAVTPPWTAAQEAKTKEKKNG